jgi:hypothetical protein
MLSKPGPICATINTGQGKFIGLGVDIKHLIAFE